jgi:hypothetical protein
MTYRAPSILLVALAIGCGGQVGEETIMCAAVNEQSLSLDETTPLGFTAQDVLDVVGGEHAEPLLWADDVQTTVTLGVNYAGGSLRFLERDWIDDSGIEIARSGCEDIIEIETGVALTTDDGELAESWTLRVEAETADQIVFYEPLEQLAGTLDIERFAPDKPYDFARAFLDMTVTAAGLDGSISGQIEGSDGEVAWAENYTIATIGTSDE